MNKATKKNKLILILSIITIFITVFVGCGDRGGEDEEEGASKSQEEGRLIIGGPWFPGNLDPVNDATMSLRLGILDTLVNVDYESQLVPGLAKNWDVSEDGLTWTFNLRDDVDFHDETHMDADTVQKSLTRLREEGTFFEGVPIEDIEAVDDYILEISTSEYFAPLPSYLTKGETAPISKGSFDENGEFVELIGTGPYKFKEWEPDQQITIVKNEDYWGNTPEVEEIVYKEITEASTLIMMLRNNELDIAQIIPADMVEELESYDGIDVYTEPILRVRTLTFNMDNEPLDDLKVRKAINHLIDKDALVEHILAGIDKPAKGPFPNVSEWANDEIQGYSYDLDMAKEHMEEAGFQKHADGYLSKDGKKLTIDLVTYPERDELPGIAEVIGSQLGDIGIEVNIKVVEYGQADEIRNQGKFDLYLMSRNLGFIPDPGLYFMDDYHSEGTGYGAYGYANEELDDILEEAKASQDIEKRRQLYKKAQEIIVKDTPVTFLNHYVNVDAVNSHVQGYKMHPLENTFGLENIYLE